MRTWHAIGMASVLLSMALAGCTGEDGPFSIEAPDSPGGAYTFRANSEADNYTWSMGDGLTTLYGREVSHTFDFANGKVDVRLTTKTGQESKSESQPVVLGTGVNAKGTFFLEASHVWAIPGEKVKFSAASSTDPDGDPLRFSWSCLRDRDAVRQGVHPPHGPTAGLDYAKAPAGSVSSGLAVRPIPDATMPIAGDLCDALGSGTRPSTQAAVIEGAFTKTGIYKIALLARDPVHPTVSGQFEITVSNANERPEPVQTLTFSGTLQGGQGGQLQETCTTATLGVCDEEERSFALPLNALAGNLTVTFDAGPAAGSELANVVRVEIFKGNAQIATTAGKAGAFPLDPVKLEAGNYRLVAILDRGVDATWEAKLDFRLDMDPSKVY